MITLSIWAVIPLCIMLVGMAILSMNMSMSFMGKRLDGIIEKITCGMFCILLAEFCFVLLSAAS